MPALDEDSSAALQVAQQPSPGCDTSTGRAGDNGDRSAVIRVVAERDGQIVGTATYSVQSDRLHVRGLAVATPHRRTGVARAIVDHFSQLARSRGLRALSLYTIAQTGNVAVFERLGFLTIREEPADWAESDSYPELTDVYLEWPV